MKVKIWPAQDSAVMIKSIVERREYLMCTLKWSVNLILSASICCGIGSRENSWSISTFFLGNWTEAGAGTGPDRPLEGRRSADGQCRIVGATHAYLKTTNSPFVPLAEALRTIWRARRILQQASCHVYWICCIADSALLSCREPPW